MTSAAGAPLPDSDFARTTAVTPLGDGRYRCTLDPGWRTVVGINGGILMAVLVRAIEAEVGLGRGLRGLQCQFLRPPAPGEAEIHVETIRSGARATNLRVRIEQGGRLMLEGLATCFTAGLTELARWSPPLPQVPAAGEIEPTLIDPRMPPIGDHLIYRPCIGPPPLSGTPLEPGQPARSGGWLDLRDPSPVEPALLAFFIDAWWPAALGPLTGISMNPTIDLLFHIRTALPPEGLPPQALLLEVETVASMEGLCDEDARLFTADGLLLAQARQLAITLTREDRPAVTSSAREASA